jgi:ParB family chromosome partitioning protein
MIFQKNMAMGGTEMKRVFNAVKNIMTTGGKASSVKWVAVNELTTVPELSNIFPIGEDTLGEIAESIIQNGYDISQPIVVFNYEENLTIADGHTRFKAAKLAGLNQVPIIVKEFPDLEDAILYAYDRQKKRRNLTQAEIFNAAIKLKPKDSNGGSGRSVDKLSDTLGVSSATITHAITVGKRASEDDKEAIQRGEKSINEVYQKIKDKKPPKTNKAESAEMDILPANVKSEMLTGESEEAVPSKDNEMTIKTAKKDENLNEIFIPDILVFLVKNGEHRAAELISERYGRPLPENTLFSEI